jgi:hypothetical protein
VRYPRDSLAHALKIGKHRPKRPKTFNHTLVENLDSRVCVDMCSIPLPWPIFHTTQVGPPASIRPERRLPDPPGKVTAGVVCGQSAGRCPGVRDRVQGEAGCPDLRVTVALGRRNWRPVLASVLRLCGVY